MCVNNPFPELPQITHIGRSDVQRGLCIKTHYHLGYEIVYVKRGCTGIGVFSGAEPILCYPDDVFITAPRIEHEFTIEPCDIEYYWIGVQTERLVGVSKDHVLRPASLIQKNRNPVQYFEPSLEHPALEELGRTLPLQSFARISNAPEFCLVFESLLNEMKSFQSCRAYSVFANLLQLFSMLHRRLDPATTHTMRSSEIAFAIDYIRAHVTEPLKLEDVAERLGLHPSHVSRRFRQETGRTYTDFVRTERIRRAKQLLEAGLAVGTVATQSGFGSIHAFSRTFRRITGVVPSQYRGSVVHSEKLFGLRTGKVV